ncbi:thioredoxin family protein [Metapseudomonas otitidis]|uniref:thioredoxin family protein n=1 Tax=Metapseudomonas otitidis TaxID=319939 RepID=UPI00366FAE90
MATYRELFDIGQSYTEFVGSGLPAETAAAAAIAQRLEDQGPAAPLLQRIEQIERRYHLLVVGEMWCPDCQINVTVLDDLCRRQPRIDLAVITKGRAEDDLKTRLGLERIAIPLVVVLDKAFEPAGLFIERPRLVREGDEAVLRAYKAGEHLDATLADVLELIEQAEQR